MKNLKIVNDNKLANFLLDLDKMWKYTNSDCECGCTTSVEKNSNSEFTHRVNFPHWNIELIIGIFDDEKYIVCSIMINDELIDLRNGMELRDWIMKSGKVEWCGLSIHDADGGKCLANIKC